MKHIALLLFTAVIASAQGFTQNCASFFTVGPFQQTTTSTLQVVESSRIDARCFSSVSYMISVNGGNVRVWLIGTNFLLEAKQHGRDFSKEVIVQTKDITPGTTESLAHAPAVFSAYRLKVRTTPGSTPAIVTFRAIAKK